MVNRQIKYHNEPVDFHAKVPRYSLLYCLRERTAWTMRCCDVAAVFQLKAGGFIIATVVAGIVVCPLKNGIQAEKTYKLTYIS